MESQLSICNVCHEVGDIKDKCGFSNGNVCKSCIAEIIEQFIAQMNSGVEVEMQDECESDTESEDDLEPYFAR